MVAHTLLSHVDDPLAVVMEAARLVRPGGMIGIFDGDYASMTFGHDDPAKGKANDDAIISGVVTSPRVMRQMPRLLQAAGLQFVASFPYILAEVGKADFWAPAIESFRRLVPKSGAMTEQEANAWAESLARNSVAGIFFGACNYYGYVARRPICSRFRIRPLLPRGLPDFARRVGIDGSNAEADEKVRPG